MEEYFEKMKIQAIEKLEERKQEFLEILNSKYPLRLVSQKITRIEKRILQLKESENE